MKINIELLKEITFLLLSKLQENKGNEIDLQNDYYWSISDEEINNPYQEPKMDSMGQLSDELADIYRLLQTDDASIYDLKRISNILRALSVEQFSAF